MVVDLLLVYYRELMMVDSFPYDFFSSTVTRFSYIDYLKNVHNWLERDYEKSKNH